MKSVASKNPDQSVPLRQGGWCAPLVSLFVGQAGLAGPGRARPGLAIQKIFALSENRCPWTPGLTKKCSPEAPELTKTVA